MENIKYSSLIVSTTTKDGDVIEWNHRKFMEIGYKNLKDFNERVKVRTQLEYDQNDNTFSILNVSDNPRTQELSRNLLMEINRYITLDKAQFDQNFIKDEYVKRIDKNADKLKLEIITNPHIKNNTQLAEREKNDGLHWINEFIALRENSYPITILTDKRLIEKCKNEINGICSELSHTLKIGKN